VQGRGPLDARGVEVSAVATHADEAAEGGRCDIGAAALGGDGGVAFEGEWEDARADGGVAGIEAVGCGDGGDGRGGGGGGGTEAERASIAAQRAGVDREVHVGEGAEEGLGTPSS